MGFSADQDVYAPCSCGSGKKYKFCCLAGHRQERRAKENELRLSREEEPRRPESVGPKDFLVSEADRHRSRSRRPGPIVYVDGIQEQLDVCVQMINGGRAREAIPRLKKIIQKIPMLPHAYNNLALAYFVAGDLDRAIETAERVDREVDGENAFALGSLVHYYLLAGRDTDARGTLERLRGIAPRDEFAAYKKCEALARFREHEKVLEAAREVETTPDLAFFSGVALANLGRKQEARDDLDQATSSLVQGTAAQRLLKRIRHGEGPGTLEGDWPYLGFHSWISDGLLNTLKGKSAGEAYPGLAHALRAAVDERPDSCSEILPLLSATGTPHAVEILRKIAFGKFGTWEIRNDAVHHLRVAGNPSVEGPTKMWDGQEWVETRYQHAFVTTEVASVAPEHLKNKLIQQIEAHHANDHPRAERLARELVAACPKVPVFHHNLGVALQAMGSTDEAEKELRTAMGLDSSYLFARGSLAILLLARDQIDEAWAVVSTAKIAPRIHPDALQALMEAQARVALPAGEVEALRSALKVLRQIAPDSQVLEFFQRPEVQAAVELSEVLTRLWNESYAELLERKLPDEPTANDCLEGMRREQLLQFADGLGLEPSRSLRKKDVRAAIAASVADQLRVDAAVKGLADGAREALRGVLAAGGTLPRAVFVQAHDPISRGISSRQRRLNALHRAGLLFPGTIRGVESVVIPVEVRAALTAMDLP